MTDPIPPESADDASTQVRGALQTLFGEASPETVFAPPERVGDDLVITASAWERSGGFGFGGGSGSDPEGNAGFGSGGGGGGMAQGRPVAVIRVGAEGAVTVTPVIDFTKITVTVLLGIAALWKTLRR